MSNDVPTLGPMLIAYDGSDLSRRAIGRAGDLLKGREAVVLHVYDPVRPMVPTSFGPPAIPTAPDLEQAAIAEEQASERAREVARQGAREAESVGIPATGETVSARGAGGIADAIEECAERRRASLIVIGSHGHSAIRAALLGSVSTAVLHRSTVPVLVVPARPSTD